MSEEPEYYPWGRKDTRCCATCEHLSLPTLSIGRLVHPCNYFCEKVDDWKDPREGTNCPHWTQFKGEIKFG